MYDFIEYLLDMLDHDIWESEQADKERSRVYPEVDKQKRSIRRMRSRNKFMYRFRKWSNYSHMKYGRFRQSLPKGLYPYPFVHLNDCSTSIYRLKSRGHPWRHRSPKECGYDARNHKSVMLRKIEEREQLNELHNSDHVD